MNDGERSALEQRILDYLGSLKRPHSNMVRMAKALRASSQELRPALDALEADGEIVAKGKKRISLAEGAGLISGRVSLGRRGTGVVVTDVPGPPLRLGVRDVRPALDGDRVLAEASPYSRGGLRSAKIQRIIERRRRTVVGAVSSGDPRILLAADARIAGYVIRLSDDSPPAPKGHTVAAEILEYPTTYSDLVVTVTEDLGITGTLPTEIEAVLREAEIVREFPPECQAKAEKLRPFTEADLEGREDLRDLVTMTIDPATAKDHDDAIAIEKTDQGWRLVVSIADVAHYVPRGGVIDLEAYERATSVYLPGTVVPMLPDCISGDLASLRPDVDRPVVTAFLDVSEDGAVTSTRFARSVIRSRARIAYEQAQAALDDPSSSDLPAAALEALPLLRDCATALMNRRMKRGAVDLDLPEAEIIVDEDGDVVDIRKRERLFAHRIVEESMLAANEAVATFLEKQKMAFLYRIHEAPDQQAFTMLGSKLRALGLNLRDDGEKILPSALGEPLRHAKGKPIERQVNFMILRAMTQARYSADKEIHFGLASSSYCHFTSPIRRYPDLIVHRALLTALGHDCGILPPTGILVEEARHCSLRERRAADAERDTAKAAAVLLLAPRVGAIFSGTVATVDHYGYMVELDEVFVQGFVHVGRHNEYLDYEAEHMELLSRSSGTTIRIGDKVEVRLLAVDLSSRAIELEPV